MLLLGQSRAALPNNITWAADIDIVGRSTGGTDNAYFKRRLLIKRGANASTTAFVGSVQTIGTDIGSGSGGVVPTGWDVSFTADTTNGSLNMYVTGWSTSAISWTAKLAVTEVGRT